MIRLWQNYGDVNFIEYGGCLVAEDQHPECFHIMSLTTDIYDYHAGTVDDIRNRAVLRCPCPFHHGAW